MACLNFKNQLDEKTKELILGMEEELKIKNKEIESKEKEITHLKNELEYLRNQILNKNRKIFGASSERVDSSQLSF